MNRKIDVKTGIGIFAMLGIAVLLFIMSYLYAIGVVPEYIGTMPRYGTMNLYHLMVEKVGMSGSCLIASVILIGMSMAVLYREATDNAAATECDNNDQNVMNESR